MEAFIQNESDQLKSVLVGIADSFGGTPVLADAYDPKSKEHILAGTFPLEQDLKLEIEGFVKVLEKYNVKVYRPSLINNCNQIFTRDISFVIDDTLVVSNMISNRKDEQDAITYLIELFDKDKVIHMPKGARAEGGDVMIWNDHVFIGYEMEPDFSDYKTSRTNEAGVAFIKEHFPNKNVVAFELRKSDTNAKENALHLDCCFQPVGKNKAVLHKNGFKNEKDYNFLIEFFGADNCLNIDEIEMYNMGSNFFSISQNVVVSERRLKRVNDQLRSWGLQVEEIKYSEVAKMEGLLRCSTMPIHRKND
ncbi:MAG: N-dimethylarginine dimethylaminohydrolase [Patiriisocius sp.]